MRCRCCGAENPEHELRCVKCQMRLSPPAARPAPETYPVFESAAAPDLLRQPAAEPVTRRPVLASSRPDAVRETTPTQPALFPYREPRKVVELNPKASADSGRPAEPHRSTPRRRTAPGQSAFDFDGPQPPSRPITREIARRTDFAVAPIQLRAMASLFDLGLAVGFLSIFLATVWLCIGQLPLHTAALACYAASSLIIAALYKTLWCTFGQVTLGIQGAHLNIVSFDGLRPTRTQRFLRMASSWLSLLSAGMGLLWALADQESLSWHDHISQTFLTHQPPDEEDAE